MKKLIIILMASLIILGIVGWTKNLIKFVKLDFEAPYKAEVIRGIGLTSYSCIIG